MSFRFKRNILRPGCFLSALAALFAAAATVASAQTTLPAILPVGARAQYAVPSGVTLGALTYSTANAATGNGSGSNGAIVQRDAAGDIFILDATPQVLEIPASGPLQVAVPSTDNAITTAKASGGQVSMTVDPAGSIYISGSTTPTLIKITRSSTGAYNLGSSNETNIIGLLEGSCDGYYLQLKGAFAVDASGNIYGIMNSSTQAGIIAGGPTVGGCKYIYGSNTNTPALTADPLSLAVDNSGDVFFVDGVSVKEITAAQVTASTVSTPAVPTVIGNSSCTGCTALSLPSAITIDPLGNLIVGGKGTAALYAMVSILPLNAGFSSTTPIYLLPNTISGTATTAGFTTIGAYVATDNQGDFYSVNGTAIETYGSGSLQVTGSGNIFAVPYPVTTTADSSTQKMPSIGFLFTQATSLVSPFSAVLATGAPYGGPASPTYPQFKQSSTTCGATQAVGSTCFTTVTYSPKFPGNAFGAVVLYGTGSTIASEVTVQSIFTGPAVAIDDGTKTTVGTGYVTPSGMALDASGNMYVADRGANAVYKYAPGASTTTSGTSVVTTFGTSVTPASLSKPTGVAVDAAGDLFVADTGNNRVLYMPNNNGTLGAAQVVTVTGFTLSAPRGVAFDGFGKLYIADTGNSRIIRLSNPLATSITLPATVGSGFSAPVAMAFDQFQDMFVADSGLASIVEIQGGFGFTGTGTANFGSGNGTSTPTMIGTGLSSPTGVAVDASGTVYVADGGNSRVVKIPYTGGAYGTATVLFSATASAISKPYGLVLDVTGDLYFTDADQPGLYFAQRSQPNGSTTILLPLMLPDAAVNGTSTASTILSNQGYVTSLTESVGTLSAPFSLSTNGCANAALAAGASCTDVVTFTGPSTTDTPSTASLVFTTNELNISTSPTTTISLSGASTGAVATVAITGATTITYGETETYTVTAYDNGSPARPAASANGTQTITITGCGSFSPTVTLNGGTGNFVLPSVAAGTCTLSTTIGGVAGSLNVVVNKAPLTISPTAITRPFDTANPALGVTYTGLVNGDTSSVVSGTPTVSTTATRISPAGTYTITLTGTFSATNYTITVANGVLTVTGSAPQVILFDALPAFTGGSTVTLVGISTSGLPLSYSTSAGTISGNVLTVPATGTAVTVTASQPGNTSYAAASSVTRTFTAQ